MISSMVDVYSYSRCSTCRKALKWLDSHQIPYRVFDIVQDPPSKETLCHAFLKLGNRQLLFNTSGISYRTLGASAVKAMNDDEALDALASDGKLIKRPFLVFETSQILVGFKPEIWSQVLIK